MNKGIDTIKKITLKVGKTIVSLSGNGVTTRPRYRLMLIDESRFTTMWSFRGHRRRFLLWGIAVFLIITIGGAALLGVTPLRTLLPGYLRSGQRTEIGRMAQVVDSMQHAADVNNLYMDNLLAILNEEVSVDSLTQAYSDSVNAARHLPADSLLATSEAEKEFVRRHERQEQFNVTVLSPMAAQGMAFMSPLASSVASSVDGAGRVTWQPGHRQPVTSVMKGTVIDTYFVPDDGYTVIVQHPNEFLSRYSGIADLMVGRGDKIDTGAALGMTRLPSAAGPAPVTFEMWFNGSQLNPKSYIEI